MKTSDPNDGLHLAAIPKADPFVTPDGFFERFPHDVQAAVAAQRRPDRSPWYLRWAFALPVVALLGLCSWWALRDAPPPATAQVEVTPLSDDELAYLDEHDAQTLLDEASGADLGEVDLRLNDDELLAYLENEHADITELIDRTMSTLFQRAALAAMLGAAAITGFAQDDDMSLPADRKQEIKAQKVAFLTQRMDLTTEEAQKFWPVYNQYDKEMEAVRQQMRDLRKDTRSKGELTEATASKAIDDALNGYQQELDIRKRYAGEFKKTIGAVKTVQLLRAEKDFNRELLKRVRGHGEQGAPPPHRRP
ncbi:MAG: hypothetical protein QM724_11465 [Flavobacteriales bacterium]